MIAVAVGCAVAIAMLPGAAIAKAPRPQLAPAAPTRETPITVTWKARPAKKGTRYVALMIVRGSYGDGFDCVSYVESPLRPTRRGYAGVLRPTVDRNIGASTQWCPGAALVTISRFGPGKLRSAVLAGARTSIVLGAGEQQPSELQVPAVRVKMTVLPGSTITASAPGRPDRSSPVGGVVRGFIPGRFKPNTDVGISYTTGGLAPSAFAPDPLCPGTPAPATFDIAAGSQQTLFASGDQSMTLVLNGAASQLFGCGPAGPLSGTTTIPLSGHVGPRGLLELSIAGSVGGIPLPGGSTGGLAANLLVSVDLSGRD